MQPLSRPIVQVVQHLAPGGLEVMALELARAQARRHPVLVVSLEGDAASACAAWPRLAQEATPLVFMGKRPGVDLALPVRLARLFRRVGAVGVQTHHIGPLLYAGLAARGLRNLRCVHTEHDAWHLQNAKRRRLARVAMRIARPVLAADAPHVADAVQAALGGARPHVVLTGVDTERFAPGDRAAARDALGLPVDVPVVGIAARLERVKGVDIALRALAALPGVRLAVAGSGSERANLQALAVELGIAARIRWLGHVDDTATLYQAADVVCLPSRAEGLPLAALEAQACGRRVVASRVGGVPAALDPASGVLVEAENPEALARGLRLALREPERGEPRTFVARTASLDAMDNAYSTLLLGDAP